MLETLAWNWRVIVMRGVGALVFGPSPGGAGSPLSCKLVRRRRGEPRRAALRGGVGGIGAITVNLASWTGPQPAAEFPDRVAQDSRDVHLGAAELFGDL